jgi:uncharacterized cupin superfamily protein
MAITPPRKHIVRASDHASEEQSFSHPLNPNSRIRGVTLSEFTGLERIGIHLLRVAPGKESFVYHRHHGEEEFVFVISGRGIAEIGDEEFEIGPGDFLGFPTPSVGHHLRNPFTEELAYLSGGERRPMEIADYPRLGKRMVRVGRRVSIHPIASAEHFPGFEDLE